MTGAVFATHPWCKDPECCHCHDRFPSYPTCRDTLHLPDCWLYPNRVIVRFVARVEPRGARDEANRE